MQIRSVPISISRVSEHRPLDKKKLNAITNQSRRSV